MQNIEAVRKGFRAAADLLGANRDRLACAYVLYEGFNKHAWQLDDTSVMSAPMLADMSRGIVTIGMEFETTSSNAARALDAENIKPDSTRDMPMFSLIKSRHFVRLSKMLKQRAYILSEEEFPAVAKAMKLPNLPGLNS